jgi:toxin HigB-1
MYWSGEIDRLEQKGNNVQAYPAVVVSRAFLARGPIAGASDRKLLPPDMAERIRDILTAIEAAETIEALSRPSFRLHALKGELKGFWAVTVRANWRIIFRFANGKASDVDFVDYH